MHNIPFIPGGIDNLSRDSRSSRVTYQYYIFQGIYNTDTSREIDRLSGDKLSMPPGIKGILCIKFDLFKIKNTDFWAAYGLTLPFTTTLAPSSLILFIVNSGVVSGTTTVTGIFSCLPAYAAANPALPPKIYTIVQS